MGKIIENFKNLLKEQQKQKAPESTDFVPDSEDPEEEDERPKKSRKQKKEPVGGMKKHQLGEE